MEDLIALYQTVDRLPSFKGPSPGERTLAVWLQRRRHDANRGALSPIYREGLKAIPGWDQQPGRKAKDDARWHQRLAEQKDYITAGNDWPRHKKTDNEQEPTPGIWLHTQRRSAVQRQQRLALTATGPRHADAASTYSQYIAAARGQRRIS